MHKRVGENEVGSLNGKGMSLRSDIKQQIDVDETIPVVSVLRFVSAPEGALYLLCSMKNIYGRQVGSV